MGGCLRILLFKRQDLEREGRRFQGSSRFHCLSTHMFCRAPVNLSFPPIDKKKEFGLVWFGWRILAITNCQQIWSIFCHNHMKICFRGDSSLTIILYIYNTQNQKSTHHFVHKLLLYKMLFQMQVRKLLAMYLNTEILGMDIDDEG